MTTGKGKKRTKGEPALHEEVKKPHTIWLTASAWKTYKVEAVLKRSSVSEVIENVAAQLKIEQDS